MCRPSRIPICYSLPDTSFASSRLCAQKKPRTKTPRRKGERLDSCLGWTPKHGATCLLDAQRAHRRERINVLDREAGSTLSISGATSPLEETGAGEPTYPSLTTCWAKPTGHHIREIRYASKPLSALTIDTPSTSACATSRRSRGSP